jgi:hypothetical protein
MVVQDPMAIDSVASVSIAVLELVVGVGLLIFAVRECVKLLAKNRDFGQEVHHKTESLEDIVLSFRAKLLAKNRDRVFDFGLLVVHSETESFEAVVRSFRAECKLKSLSSRVINLPVGDGNFYRTRVAISEALDELRSTTRKQIVVTEGPSFAHVLLHRNHMKTCSAVVAVNPVFEMDFSRNEFRDAPRELLSDTASLAAQYVQDGVLLSFYLEPSEELSWKPLYKELADSDGFRVSVVAHRHTDTAHSIHAVNIMEDVVRPALSSE